MDTVTHVLLGAVCAAAITKAKATPVKDLRMRLAVAATAAAFPDVDYLSFWIDPLLFLADWHRTATHSLLLMPLWAAMLCSLWMFSRWARREWLSVYGLCLIGISSHILLDLLTVYGIRIFYPMSDSLFFVGTTFVIDAIITLLLAVTFIVFLRSPMRAVALSGLLLLSCYVGIQWGLRTHAYTIVAAQVPDSSDLHLLPQPFSPLYWKIIKRNNNDFQLAYLSLFAEDRAFIADYRSARTLEWQQYSLLGNDDSSAPLVYEAWGQPQFLKFREFAHFPVLYRLDKAENESCVWFTDLRYILPYLTPSFRYGMCHNQEDTWALYRLKRFTQNEREALSGIHSFK